VTGLHRIAAGNRRARVVTMVLAVGALLGTGCGQPGNAATNVVPSTVDSTSARGTTPSAATGVSGPLQHVPSESLSAIDSYLARRYAADYGGLTVDGQGVAVFRRANVSLDRDVTGRFPKLRLRFVNAVHSRRELRGIAARIQADMPEWRGRGIRIMSIATPPDGSTVRIGTPHPEAGRRALIDRYGSDVVTVVKDLGAAF
jgi:hypothetical protein